ncbi:MULTISPECIES: CDP-alcohol phosphatidyltransferase family protein [Halostella]|uniref:CDP-alcohol phosphatidyltransferase family protein n=1 Tax=Halostella TaxID=1843185 RepID=UPI001081FD1F|nr:MULTISPECIES: CDP-alcohol phosphatidyltransferase family protein [Halostella]
MTLDQLRPYVSRLIGPWVSAADRLGLTPNGVSAVAGLVAGAAGAAYFLAGTDPVWYVVGSTLVVLNGWFDVIDGALAREQGVDSKAGDLLDHVLDRYADIVIIAGIAAGVERYALGLAAVTGVLMTSYLGTQAQAVGLDRLYAGLVGRADRLVIIAAVGFVAYFVDATAYGLSIAGWLLAFLAVVGHLTAGQRFFEAWGRLS